MKKTIKPIFALSAFMLLLLSANALIEPSYSGAYGNEWDALFNVPPFRELAINDDAGGVVPAAPINNELTGSDTDAHAGAQNRAMFSGIKDCASRDSLLLFSALLALLTVYAVLRVARRRGRPVFKSKS